MIKNNSKHTFIFPETPVRSILSDVAEVEPIYTVGPYLVLVCWLLIQTDIDSINYLQFFVFKEIKFFFSKLGPYNPKIISIPISF